MSRKNNHNIGGKFRSATATTRRKKMFDRIVSITGCIGGTICEKLSDLKLKRLAEHKYSATGATLLDPLLQIFWRWFLEHCVPLWWAPNAMTLVGLVVNIITCSLLVYYSPDAKQEIPAYALVLAALGLFIYQTLDACDGKQARRTKTSSSLGELFDHGCDAISTIFVSLSVCLSVQLGYMPNWMVVLCAGATSLFYSAHWQTYVSGTLKFGKFDVTEAQYTIIIIHLISAIFGTSFWNNTIFGIQYKLFPVIVTVLNECFILIRDLKLILSGGAGKNGSTVAGTSILSPVIPILLVFLFTLIIYTKSPSTVFVDNISLYIIAFGFVAGKITNKLVVAHMSKSEMSKIDTIFVGPLLLFFNQYFNFYFDEYHLLLVAFAYILVDFCYSCYSTCHQLADFLGINILTITSTPKPRSVSTSGGTSSGGSNANEEELSKAPRTIFNGKMANETDSLLSSSPTPPSTVSVTVEIEEDSQKTEVEDEES